MKNMDYYYLSTLNLKRNKTRTRIAVFTMTIGMLFSSLALFTIIAFYFGSLGLDYNTSFNSISFSHTYDILGDKYSKVEDRKIYDNFDGLDNVISYDFIVIRSTTSKPMYIYYDNELITSDMKNIRTYAVENFDSRYIEQYANDNTGKPFLIKGKSTIGKNEIMLSHDFIILNGLSENVVGKDISIKAYYSKVNGVYYRNGDDLIEDTYSGYYDVFVNYKVVGIFNSQSTYRNGTLIPMIPYGADILLSNESIFNTNIDISHDDKYINYKFIYDKSIENLIKEANEKNLVLSSNPMNSSADILYFRSFAFTNNAYNLLKTVLSEDVFKNEVSVNQFFERYSLYHSVVTSIMLFLSILGGLILIIAVLNIFNIIKYDISKKTRNMGILKSMGFKDKEIFKLKLFEFYNYLIKSTLISFVLGLIISIIFTIFMNKVLNYGDLGLNVYARIDFWYYFIAYIVILALIFIISYVYTIIVSKKIVKNKPIVLLNKR